MSFPTRSLLLKNCSLSNQGVHLLRSARDPRNWEQWAFSGSIMNTSAWTVSWVNSKDKPSAPHSHPRNHTHNHFPINILQLNNLKHLHCNWGHMGTTPRRVTHKHSLFTGVVSEQQRCSSQSRAQSHFKTLRVGCTTDTHTTAENPVLGREPCSIYTKEGAIAIYTQTTEQFTLVVSYTKVKKKKKVPRQKTTQISISFFLN